ncbi:MAG: hypothetical protein C0623_08895 [Desulfuromonas sp.]|nr:MAG: hypothetical protein C0623_08895 [Desulfuromonas sp.]
MRVGLWKPVVLVVAASFVVSGCLLPPGPHRSARVVASPPTPAKSGPPAHAKAYGHRSRFTYHYYPDARVYFDTGRGAYFFLRNGVWEMSASLPTQLRIDLGARVTLDMDLDRPYLRFEEHKKKYPGKKKKHKVKGKKKKKHEKDD